MTPFTIVEDSREQTPLDFSPFEAQGVSVVRKKLRTGDYSVLGMEREIIIERKSLADCVSSLTHGRERLTRELYDRAIFAPVRHFVVEASWYQLSQPYDFAPGANPESIVNSLFAFMQPPLSVHVFASARRELLAWYIVKACSLFLHRVSHGAQGVWKSLFAPNARDLAPFADVDKHDAIQVQPPTRGSAW